MMSHGSQFAGHAGDRRQGVTGGPGRDHRLVQRCLSADGVQAHPDQDAVVVAGKRPPAQGAGVTVESQPVPSAVQDAIAHDPGGKVGTQVRAASGTDPQAVLLVAPRDQLDAGDACAERATHAHVAARAEHVPVSGRSALGSIQRGVDDRRAARRGRLGAAASRRHAGSYRRASLSAIVGSTGRPRSLPAPPLAFGQ